LKFAWALIPVWKAFHCFKQRVEGAGGVYLVTPGAAVGRRAVGQLEISVRWRR